MQPSGKLSGRIPARGEVLTVFNFALFAIASWSVRAFLFKFPSFRLYFDIPDILSILLYMLAFALLESIALTLLLVIASALLPPTWLKSGFDYKGFLAVLVVGIASILLQYSEVPDFPPLRWLAAGTAACLLAWGLLALGLHFLPRLRTVVLGFVERFAIFSYIYVPLGTIGILVVLIRNLI